VAVQVLIVDDHASFRRLARLLLQAAGFDVVGEAADAKGARGMIERLRPDAVLLDVMLPDGSGVDVARELADEPGSPRVVLTSSRSRSDFGPSFDLPGGCNFIPKHELSGPALSRLLTGT
jgi:two-component system nitrate/nitrite response regulator NarL